MLQKVSLLLPDLKYNNFPVFKDCNSLRLDVLSTDSSVGKNGMIILNHLNGLFFRAVTGLSSPGNH
jgi:hypothetical protein